MSIPNENQSGPHADRDEPVGEGVRLILVVDDSRAQRLMLRKQLERLGYAVVEAESGHEALDVADLQPVDLVLSDWMMPGMDGIEFCKAFRQLDRDRYGYFILLTSKSERADVLEAFEAGADDFLTKPVEAQDLGARLNAGDRIVRMQSDLAHKNKQLSSLVEELHKLSDALDRDLDEARALQQSLVPKRNFDLEVAEVSLLFRPAGKVGGDLCGLVPISDSRVGLYSIDVSGHGIASALMTARIAGLLSGPTPDRNLALDYGENGEIVMQRPDLICDQLNSHLIEDMDTEHYITAMIADCDLATGQVRVVQAGHPAAIVMSADGKTRRLGEGGMPVGLLPGPVFDTFDLEMQPGERLFMFTDGLVEAPGAAGGFLEDDGLEELLKTSKSLSGEEFLEALIWDVYRFSGGSTQDDDISGVVLDYKPNARGA